MFKENYFIRLKNGQVVSCLFNELVLSCRNGFISISFSYTTEEGVVRKRNINGSSDFDDFNNGKLCFFSSKDCQESQQLFMLTKRSDDTCWMMINNEDLMVALQKEFKKTNPPVILSNYVLDVSSFQKTADGTGFKQVRDLNLEYDFLSDELKIFDRRICNLLIPTSYDIKYTRNRFRVELPCDIEPHKINWVNGLLINGLPFTQQDVFTIAINFDFSCFDKIKELADCNDFDFSVFLLDAEGCDKCEIKYRNCQVPQDFYLGNLDYNDDTKLSFECHINVKGGTIVKFK